MTFTHRLQRDGSYLELQNNRPFFNTKSSFSTAILHYLCIFNRRSSETGWHLFLLQFAVLDRCCRSGARNAWPCSWLCGRSCPGRLASVVAAAGAAAPAPPCRRPQPRHHHRIAFCSRCHPAAGWTQRKNRCPGLFQTLQKTRTARSLRARETAAPCLLYYKINIFNKKSRFFNTKSGFFH